MLERGKAWPAVGASLGGARKGGEGVARRKLGRAVSSSSSMMESSLLTELWRNEERSGRTDDETDPTRLSCMMTFHIGISRWK